MIRASIIATARARQAAKDGLRNRTWMRCSTRACLRAFDAPGTHERAKKKAAGGCTALLRGCACAREPNPNQLPALPANARPPAPPDPLHVCGLTRSPVQPPPAACSMQSAAMHVLLPPRRGSAPADTSSRCSACISPMNDHRRARSAQLTSRHASTPKQPPVSAPTSPNIKSRSPTGWICQPAASPPSAGCMNTTRPISLLGTDKSTLSASPQWRPPAPSARSRGQRRAPGRQLFTAASIVVVGYS